MSLGFAIGARKRRFMDMVKDGCKMLDGRILVDDAVQSFLLLYYVLALSWSCCM